MCGGDNEPGSHDPDVVASLKELARKRSGKRRTVCGNDGAAAECWLEGAEVRSRGIPSAGQAPPMAASGAALPEFAALAPKPESGPGGREVAGPGGTGTAIRDVTHSSGAAMCRPLPGRVDTELPTPDCPRCGKPIETWISIDPEDPSTFPKGRIDTVRVDATTEAEIAMQEREDGAEAPPCHPRRSAIGSRASAARQARRAPCRGSSTKPRKPRSACWREMTVTSVAV